MRMADIVVLTPLVPLRLLLPITSRKLGTEIHLTLEALQPIGSCQVSGALIAARHLLRKAIESGIWRAGASNAAQ